MDEEFGCPRCGRCDCVCDERPRLFGPVADFERGRQHGLHEQAALALEAAALWIDAIERECPDAVYDAMPNNIGRRRMRELAARLRQQKGYE